MLQLSEVVNIGYIPCVSQDRTTNLNYPLPQNFVSSGRTWRFSAESSWLSAACLRSKWGYPRLGLLIRVTLGLGSEVIGPMHEIGIGKFWFSLSFGGLSGGLLLARHGTLESGCVGLGKVYDSSSVSAAGKCRSDCLVLVSVILRFPSLLAALEKIWRLWDLWKECSKSGKRQA